MIPIIVRYSRSEDPKLAALLVEFTDEVKSLIPNLDDEKSELSLFLEKELLPLKQARPDE